MEDGQQGGKGSIVDTVVAEAGVWQEDKVWSDPNWKKIGGNLEETKSGNRSSK